MQSNYTSNNMSRFFHNQFLLHISYKWGGNSMPLILMGVCRNQKLTEFLRVKLVGEFHSNEKTLFFYFINKVYL